MNLSSYKKIYENMEADKTSKNEISHASSHSDTAIPRSIPLFLCNSTLDFVKVCSVLPDDVEAKSEIRLPIFESCPLTNRPGMVGESTFSENPSHKSALLNLSKESITTHVEIISEIENVPNYLRVQWLEKGCGGQSRSFWLTQHPLHQVGSPTCI